MIEAAAESLREDYRRERMRAGTLEQYAALHCAHAKVDAAIAKAHWHAYAKAHGIDAGRYGFDYYGWACAYLHRVGLYEVPVTEEMRASATGGIPADVLTYKYGARWL
jgi:hypothetical protein